MNDFTSFGLSAALQVYYEKYKKDPIIGIKSRPTFSRPNWNQVFSEPV